jgi:hypothetical protein
MKKRLKRLWAALSAAALERQWKEDVREFDKQYQNDPEFRARMDRLRDQALARFKEEQKH